VPCAETKRGPGTHHGIGRAADVEYIATNDADGIERIRLEQVVGLSLLPFAIVLAVASTSTDAGPHRVLDRPGPRPDRLRPDSTHAERGSKAARKVSTPARTARSTSASLAQ
jgi:hypothetical protein